MIIKILVGVKIYCKHLYFIFSWEYKKTKRMIYWGEYMDCLESIQKVIFIQP